MIDKKRLDEMLWLFSTIFPHPNEEDTKKLQTIMGLTMPFDDFIGIMLRSVGEMIKQYPDESLGYLDFISQAIAYLKKETDEYPEIDYDPEELRRMYEIKIVQEKKTQKEIDKNE